MAFVHSKNTVITVASTDLSAFVTSSSEVGRTTETHEVTAYGDSAKEYAPGLNDASFSMEGTYDSTAVSGPRAKLLSVYAGGVAVAISRMPEGTGTGKPEDAFNAILTSYVETSPVNDMISWSADFQVTGAIDITAQT